MIQVITDPEDAQLVLYHALLLLIIPTAYRMWLSANVAYSHFSHFPNPFFKGVMLALPRPPCLIFPNPQPPITAGTKLNLPPALGSESLINFCKHMYPTQYKL